MKNNTETNPEAYIRKMFAELFLDLNELTEQIEKLQDKYLKVYLEDMPPLNPQNNKK